MWGRNGMWLIAPQKGPSSSKKRDMRYEILQLKEKCQSALIRERWTFPPFPQNRHYQGREKQMHHLYPAVSPLSPVQTLVLKHRRTFLPLSLSLSLSPVLFLSFYARYLWQNPSAGLKFHSLERKFWPSDPFVKGGTTVFGWSSNIGKGFNTLFYFFRVINDNISWLNKTWTVSWLQKDAKKQKINK